MRKLFLIVTITLISISGFSQNTYVLLDSKLDSDINYAAISEGNFSPKNALDSVFNYVSGSFKVYRFIEVNYGYGFESDSLTTFRDILIIKTNSSGKIIDAFQYTLEWAEPPSTCDLYRLNKGKGIKLDSKLNLSSLRFKLVNEPSYCGRDPYLYLSQNRLIQGEESLRK
jgi:hypothetical protein